jgi:hypothetical protein
LIIGERARSFLCKHAIFAKSQEGYAMNVSEPMRHAHTTPEPDIPPPEPQKDPPPDNTPLPEHAPVEEPTPPKIPVKTQRRNIGSSVLTLDKSCC